MHYICIYVHIYLSIYIYRRAYVITEECTWKCLDCVYIDFVFKALSNSQYLHINLKVSLNSGDSRLSLVVQSLIVNTKEAYSTVTTLYLFIPSPINLRCSLRLYNDSITDDDCLLYLS